MKSKTLGISWLHGRLTLANRTGSLWSSPVPITTPEAFRQALRDGLAATRLRAHRVAFVIDHRSLHFHVQDTPPAKGRLLEQVIDRLVAEQRFFQEPALWTRSQVNTSGTATRSLLAVMPQSLFALLENSAAENGLDVASVLPVAALLAPALKRAASSPDESLLLVVSLGDAHVLAYGDGSGKLLFARSVTGTHDSSGIRLDQEINRTRHFIQQQFGAPVSRIVRTSDPLTDDAHPGANLARATLESSKGNPFDFCSRHGRAPRWVRPLIATATSVGFTAALAVAALVESAVHHRQSELQQARTTRQGQLDAARLGESVHREGQKLTALLQTIGATDSPSVPALFPTYLRQQIPEAFRLTRLEIHPSTNGWSVALEGRSRDRGTRFLTAIEAFENQLARGPFAVRITDSTHRRTVDPTAAASTASLASRNLVPAGLLPREPDQPPFHLTGVIQ